MKSGAMRRGKVKILSFIYCLLQLSWGLFQSLPGLILMLSTRKNCRHYWYRGSYVTHWKHPGGISLGMFIFISNDSLLVHEYGHSIQSLILGPLYLLVIGLPSLLWANSHWCIRHRQKNHLPYSFLYTERWADSLGEHFSGLLGKDRP